MKKRFFNIKVFCKSFILSCCVTLLIGSLRTQTIHIYFECVGTTPVFGGLLHYVKAPKEDLKIIGWHRIPDIEKRIDFNENHTIVVSLPKCEWCHQEKKDVFFQQVLLILKERKNYQLVFHTSAEEVSFVAQLLRALSAPKVKHIYFYEDGFFNWAMGARLSYKSKYSLEKDVEKLKNYIAHKTNQLPRNFPFGHVYPTTYYVADFPNESVLKDSFFNVNGQNLIQKLDLKKYARNFQPHEKMLMGKILNFDYENLARQLKGKDFVLFAGGHIHDEITDSWKQTPENMIRIIDNLYKGKYGKLPENMIFGFKLHPSLGITDIAPLLKKKFPQMIEIPARVPYETLIIYQMEPKLLLSSGSSFLFWCRSDQILKYISQPLYDRFLFHRKIVRKEQVIYPHFDVSAFNYPLPFYFKEKQKLRGLIPEYAAKRYCYEDQPFSCFKIEKETKNQIVIKNDREEEEEIYYRVKGSVFEKQMP